MDNIEQHFLYDLKELGIKARDLPALLEWLRECDYTAVNYERNYDLIDNG